jgi:hypothetical protein
MIRPMFFRGPVRRKMLPLKPHQKKIMDSALGRFTVFQRNDRRNGALIDSEPTNRPPNYIIGRVAYRKNSLGI